VPDDYARLLRPTPAALDTSGLPQAKAIAERRQFRALWVRFPLSWLVALEQTKSASAIKLALKILFAEFHRQHTGGEVVLSAAMSGMPNATRVDATRELIRLGLIEVEQSGRGAPRVVRVSTVIQVTVYREQSLVLSGSFLSSLHINPRRRLWT
jgi:hypothetical protein